MHALNARPLRFRESGRARGFGVGLALGAPPVNVVAVHVATVCVCVCVCCRGFHLQRRLNRTPRGVENPVSLMAGAGPAWPAMTWLEVSPLMKQQGAGLRWAALQVDRPWQTDMELRADSKGLSPGLVHAGPCVSIAKPVAVYGNKDEQESLRCLGIRELS